MTKVYAYRNDYTVRINSASGGAFSAIVNSWIANNIAKGISQRKMIIYGAAFDEGFDVKHIGCNVDTWSKLRGSKYIPSDISGIFELIEQDLNNNCKILFSGTPCQIEALNKKIEKNNWNRRSFLLVDVICHGVPEKEIWSEYKKYIEDKYGGSITKYSFRYKKTYSSEPIVYAEFSNGKIVRDSMLLRSYMDLYFTYLPLKKACYICPFSNMNRVSDITIGDFWGAKNIFKNVKNTKELSQVIINTDYGEIIFGEMQRNKLNFCLECKTKEYLKYQHNLVSPTPRPLNVEEFWHYFKNNGYEASIYKYIGAGMIFKLKFKFKRVLSYLGIKKIFKEFLKKI